MTKYVRFMNSRGSLLYWKAKNERTDGRTDDRYGPGKPPNDPLWVDVDFGANHPTSITKDELGVLSRWIDTTRGAGDGYLLDTTKPALNVVGDVKDGQVRALFVGTARRAVGNRSEVLDGVHCHR